MAWFALITFYSKETTGIFTYNSISTKSLHYKYFNCEVIFKMAVVNFIVINYLL